MFVVHTSNCHGQNCTRRAIYRLGIDTLIANILVSVCEVKLFFLVDLILFNGVISGLIHLCEDAEVQKKLTRIQGIVQET